MSKVVLFLIICMGLSACIEVKNSDSDEKVVRPLLTSKEITSLEVDEPLYFWEGKFLTESQWGEITSQNLKPQKLVYEFSIDEMYLSDRAILYTNGFIIKFSIGKFYSDRGQIKTFPPGQKARVRTPGRSGGHLLFNIHEADGFLSVSMLGEEGGDGEVGSKPDASLDGRSGSAPMCSISSNLEFKVIKKEVIAEKGKGGFSGENGFRGGDSGILEVFVKTPSAFNVDPIIEAGAGGVGGAGGAGGLGGLLARTRCFENEPKKGARAASGPAGADGNLGASGLNQNFYISLP